jgi:3D (Asp-Asp-Asp) domain-containing protein
MTESARHHARRSAPRRAARASAAAGARRATEWLALALLAASCAFAAEERSLVVEASAYNSLPGQTDGDPALGAWGDRLSPGTKAIAVSRDLIELGIGHRTRVRIEGLPGEYVVLDKMARRWRRKIDIYMGEDVEAARSWGVREVRIRWAAPD